MAFRTGETIGGFTIDRLLGRGAYGEVFLVQRQGRYAMKVISYDAAHQRDVGSKSSDPALEAALAEAALLQELRYPHIVSCEDVLYEMDRQVVCLVLEYMDGGDLHGLIDRQREAGTGFDAHFPRRVLAAVGGALQYIHGVGILHRDVKPANILLSRRSGRIKISDFGISKLVEATTLQAHSLVGTPYYFAPELVSGDAYGAPADGWALGAVVYEVAALRRPFEALRGDRSDSGQNSSQAWSTMDPPSGPGEGGGSPWGSKYDGKDKEVGGEGGILQMPRELQVTFLLLFVTAMCLHADQNLAAPNLSQIASDFQMTPMQKDSRLGGLVQFGFFLVGGAVSVLVGPAADQFDRINVLCCVVLCGCIPSLLMSLMVPSTKAGFFYFFMARICTGVAIGGSFPVLFAFSADVFPASQRALISGALNAAGNVGAALGGLMSGVVGPSYGWRMPFTIVALPTLVCAALVRLLLADPRTQQKAKAKREEVVTNEAFSAWMGGAEIRGEGLSMEDLDLTKFQKVFAVKSNMLVFAQALPGCIPISVIVTFLADYLATDQGMAVEASTAITAVFGMSCLAFGVTGGILGQSLWNQRQKKMQHFCLLTAAGMLVAPLPFMLLVNSSQALITTSSGRPTLFAFFLALCGGSAALAGPNIRAVLMNVNPSERRGTVFSAFTLCDDLGKGLGPSIVVALVSLLGRRKAFTLAFGAWWISGAIVTQLRSSLSIDASRGGDSILPTKKM
ncbi:nek2 [Symbiodinium necroappetens]|uniref:non-specific serine/threonine protein kinase n=1 Tax=Symbiodinium necroappetens TaxID=1628268 RepID=A0A812KZ28_9DINO|nr:nek2 [Symbiodinium necroappetens]